MKKVLKFLIFAMLANSLFAQTPIVSRELSVRSSDDLGAQTPATPGGNTANPKQQVLSPLIGRWNCSGKFARSGKSIENTISFTSILDGNWMLVQHDDLPPNKFHALELWRFDSESKRFIATLFDNFAKEERRFTSQDKGPEKLTWERSVDGVLEQFVFELSGKKLDVGYQVKRPPATDWTLVDSLTCSQKQ